MVASGGLASRDGSARSCCGAGLIGVQIRMEGKGRDKEMDHDVPGREGGA